MEYAKLNFTDDEWFTIQFNLGIAAERFDEHIQTMRDANQPRLADQFERQAKQARELAQRIEEAI